jgi:hypothetical protein
MSSDVGRVLDAYGDRAAEDVASPPRSADADDPVPCADASWEAKSDEVELVDAAASDPGSTRPC